MRNACLLMLLGLALAACTGAPRTSEVSRALEAEYGEIVDVAEVKRLNGVEYPPGGGSAHRYEVEYEALLKPRGPVTLLVSGGLERSMYGGALIKGIQSGHIADPQGLAVFRDIGTARWRTDELRPARVIGTAGFTKTAAGWRMSSLQTYLTEQSLNEASVGRSAGVNAASTAGDDDPIEKMVGGRDPLCRQRAEAPGVGKRPLLRRFFSRSPATTAAAYPDTAIELRPDRSLGGIRLVGAEGLCAGLELLAWSKEGLGRTVVSAPSASGYRRVSTEQASEAWATWFAHPDSLDAVDWVPRYVELDNIESLRRTPPDDSLATDIQHGARLDELWATSTLTQLEYDQMEYWYQHRANMPAGVATYLRPHHGFRPHPDVQVVIPPPTTDGWSAVSTHVKDPQLICGIFVGERPSAELGNPATESGTPQCVRR